MAALLLPLLLQNIDAGGVGAASFLAALAVLFDLTVTSLLIARWTSPKRSFNAKVGVGVLFCGLLLGGLTLPSTSVRLLALSLLEPLLLGVAVWSVVQVFRGFGKMGTVLDQVAAVQSQLAQALPGPLAHVLTHGVLTWWSLKRGPALVPANAVPVTSHLKAGRSVFIWIYIFMELPVHFALHMALYRDGGALFAWLITLADMSVVLYLLALARSYERFPSFVRDGTFYLRQGVFWQVEIPLEHIAQLTSGHHREARNLNILVVPNVTLHLTAPVVLRGFWGRRRESQCLSLFVDDPAALRALIPTKPSTL
ncbi:hypothetical protein [Deinococcus radiodurans]|uniref:hypothetical protein n=1 Tax=Deinococcus radiodurans TaxID=1299 RepID=UPI000A886A65|nr:hypothetical protein [Deinococcus radiodurans]QIP28126.1 hypothetical protein HAV23_02055 [Deinococcus radiodurans]QIP30995.1 hypothetical protein HAV35_01455 [Deinococcus radiodurans]UID71432.1 hypothetical protein DRO_2448 [Deinococcus radiodurans R1 = ATCC 13939 = DSM 20539]